MSAERKFKKLKLGGEDIIFTEVAGLSPAGLLRAMEEGDVLTLSILRRDGQNVVFHVGAGRTAPLPKETS